jgi:hypothetical protein
MMVNNQKGHNKVRIRKPAWAGFNKRAWRVWYYIGKKPNYRWLVR